MAKRGLGSVRRPPKGFNPANRLSWGEGIKFETPTKSIAEDCIRANASLRVARTLDKDDPRKRQLRTLAKKLQAEDVPPTLASMRFMRRRRRNIVGHVGQQIHRADQSDLIFWTIMPRSWEFSPDELGGVNPTELFEQFRAVINR